MSPCPYPFSKIAVIWCDLTWPCKSPKFNLHHLQNIYAGFKITRLTLKSGITYLLMSFFLTSKQVQGCGIVCAYSIEVDNIYGLGKLVSYGSIFMLCSFFSCTFFSCLRPNRKDVTFGKKPSFSGIKVTIQLSVLTFMLEELLLICSYLDRVSSKSCKNVNCIMIVVYAVRFV